MNTIFDYTDPSKFLRDAWREKKEKQPQLSLRSWSTRLGFESHSSLHLLLTGKRQIPRKNIKKLAEALGLSVKETNYLELLVEFQRAKSPDEKSYFADKIQSTRGHKSTVKMFEVESFKYLSNPLHTVILEMTALKDFNPSPEWIQSKLTFRATIKEIKDVLQRLLDFKLLEYDANGRLSKSHQHMSSKHDLEDLGVKTYHQT